MQAAREVLSVERHELRTIEISSPQSPSGGDITRSGMGTESHSAGMSESPADVSAELRSEMAGLLAFYAARIGAARRSLNRTTADIIILAILNEQTVALRALTDRWHSTAEKQRSEKLERPTGAVQRKDDEPKPS
jgi:hypothetical protein